jgi:hypothetical protein
MFKILVILVSIVLTGCKATPFVKAEMHYALDESRIEWVHGLGPDKSEVYKYDCTFDIGLKKGGLRGGLRHNSKCFVNKPFNDKDEYTRDGIFLGYEAEF